MQTKGCKVLDHTVVMMLKIDLLRAAERVLGDSGA